jgi:hypothetical protein
VSTERYSALMKTLYFFPWMLLWLGSMAVAQSTDWDVLRSIPVGKMIKVTLKQRPTFGHCALEEVTDEELFCYSRTSGEWQFERKEIRAVYVAQHAKLAGFIVGATVGAANGAANNPSNGLSRGGNATFGGLLLGGIGMAVGAAAGPFFNGRAIYRSAASHPEKPKHPSLPEPENEAKPDASPHDTRYDAPHPKE